MEFSLKRGANLSINLMAAKTKVDLLQYFTNIISWS